jgi:hypothetical protein
MSTSNYRNMGPYGMKFGEEELFRQREINQYRKDLDFLTSLRRPYGDMTQKEWEEYQRKINYMNDVFFKFILFSFIEVCLWRNG